MRLALPLDQFECVPHTDVELMLRVWRRKCFTGFREDVVYGFRLPLWYLHTLLTWFFHFKSCLIIAKCVRFVLIRLTDRTLHLLGWRGIIHFLPILPVWRDIVENAWNRWGIFYKAMNAMVSSANSRMVELRPTGISFI
jgi:hypothetical protein